MFHSGRGWITSLIRQNIIALVALFVALGGSAYAINTVTSADVVDETLLTNDIKDGQVRTDDIADGTVGTEDVSGGVGGTGSLTNADLATGSVASAEIINDSVRGEDLATGSVGSAEIVDGSITADDLTTVALAEERLRARPQRDSFTSSPVSELFITSEVPTLSFCSSLWPTDIPSDSSFAGVVAKGLSAGTYMVMATLSGAIGTNGDTKEWLTCRLRANSTEIARQTVTPREPGYRFGDPGIAEYHSLSLLGHTTVTGSVNNVFVDCQGGKDVHVRDTHLAAIQVASVG